MTTKEKKLVKVRTARNILHQGEHTPIGTTLTVTKDLANRLVHCGKAMRYESKEEVAAADEAINPMVSTPKKATKKKAATKPKPKPNGEGAGGGE